MKLLVLLVCCIVCIYTTQAAPPEPPVQIRKVDLLGSKECTYGPTYWCQNITTAAGCRAVKHCIQTVWEHQKLPEDHSSVCDTCLQMVKEARDQLESNETQEEIREVFEGSCKLIPVKIVAEACMKVADEFIVELVDALASQMNPQVVCSIAGLCNNERVHQLLAEKDASASESVIVRKQPNTCKGCHTVIEIMEKKFKQLSSDQVLENILLVCGRMGSLSDACSNIVIKYYKEIYLHLTENFNANEFCLMSGECSAMFHTHISGIEVTPLSNVGVVRIGDDLPCDLCKQLVEHLRDILVANTTESEFQKVLLGICKQTKTFEEQCTAIVNEYYPIIYNFLVHELNGTLVCNMIGMCDTPGLYQLDYDTPIAPLLPIETIQSLQLGNRPLTAAGRVGSVQIIEQPNLMQLPIERILPQTLTLMGNTQLCTFCEYFLHFVQQAITEPKTEEDIKKVVDKACELLPRSVNQTCRQFVDTYGPAFIAILAQEIDPSFVCPKLSLCPSLEAHNVEIFMHRVKGDKPNCPMCLLAVESLEQMIKNKKTEANVKQALSTLCSHLHGTVAAECKDFVETYTEQIVEACLAELNPAEVCEFLKLCKDIKPPASSTPNINYGGNIETNEISDTTANGKAVVEIGHSPLCVLCEFVLSEIDKQLAENATEEEIKDLVLNICKVVPLTVQRECIKMVNQYADEIVQLLIEELEPSRVCTSLALCVTNTANILPVKVIEPPVQENLGSPQCVLCKMIMTKIEELLQGQISEDEVLKAVHGVCSILPAQQSQDCNAFIDKYGPNIIKLLEMAIQPAEICSLMLFCSTELENVKYKIQSCSVCEVAVLVMDQILQNPNVDHELEHVLEKTCLALPTENQALCRGIIELYGTKLFKMLSEAAKPSTVCTKIGLCAKKEQLVGTNRCTWGPGYWCTNEASAMECGMLSHCQSKIWLNKKPIK